MRALPVVLILVLAGCVGAPQLDAATVPSPAAAATDAVVVHRADGAAPAADAFPAPLVATLHEVGMDAFEPTLGVDPDGRLYLAAIAARGPAIGYEPAVLRSDDGGATWIDVSPNVGGVALPPETNDPFVYVDPGTGRVFQFAMAPILVCAVLSWSDDGGESWTTNPKGCGNTPPWDHQSMVAAPARGPMTPLYPNVLVQCVNNVGSSCARSLDGGLTWTPAAPVFTDAGCGGLHGHPVAGPEGNVYLPKMHCGMPYVGISKDDGLTWTTLPASETAGHPWPDPAMAVDAAGNVYIAWVAENGELLLAWSEDQGDTWSPPVQASPAGLTTHIPAMAAGEDGRVVLAYPGTPDLPEGYASSDEAQDAASWHGYMTVVEAARSADATFATVRVNPLDDPLVRGRCGPERCPGMTDFIDVVVAPDGRAYAAYVDTCSAACAAADAPENDQSLGVVAALEGVRLYQSPS